MLERLDFWLAVIPLAMLAWYELGLGKLFGPIFNRLWRLLMSTTAADQEEIKGSSPAKNEAFDSEPDPMNPANLAAQSRTTERTSSFDTTPSEPPALALTSEECIAVARMILHRATAERFTKSSTIQAGFGVSKGASARYKRASDIYDALFAVDFGPEYRDLDTNARPVIER